MRNLRYLCQYSFAAIILFSFGAVQANDGVNLTEKYVFSSDHNSSSSHKIDYTDLNDFLPQLIFFVGESEHIHAVKSRAGTGTRISQANSKSSRLESNRILYSLLTRDNIDYIRRLKTQLEQVSKDISIADMNRDTQLSYLINLHNISVILEIAEIYPISDIQPLYEAGEECILFVICEDITPVLNEATVNIEDAKTTLGELRAHILYNWRDPLVLYGLYMGYIGAPNIRISAYQANDVWEKLEENAREFVNSIRGTQLWGRRLRVSEHYLLGEHFFPDFENDMRAHLVKYGKPQVQKWLAKSRHIDASVTNWGINDLYNGKPFSTTASADFTDFTSRIRNKFQRQFLDRNTTVTIDEIDDGNSSTEASKEKQKE